LDGFELNRPLERPPYRSVQRQKLAEPV
jgi:hypothetical protein